jgi:hypothetical protein
VALTWIQSPTAARSRIRLHWNGLSPTVDDHIATGSGIEAEMSGVGLLPVGRPGVAYEKSSASPCGTNARSSLSKRGSESTHRLPVLVRGVPGMNAAARARAPRGVMLSSRVRAGPRDRDPAA